MANEKSMYSFKIIQQGNFKNEDELARFAVNTVIKGVNLILDSAPTTLLKTKALVDMLDAVLKEASEKNGKAFSAFSKLIGEIPAEPAAPESAPAEEAAKAEEAKPSDKDEKSFKRYNK